eukprot:2377843-Rhodomonas_salina.6
MYRDFVETEYNPGTKPDYLSTRLLVLSWCAGTKVLVSPYAPATPCPVLTSRFPRAKRGTFRGRQVASSGVSPRRNQKQYPLFAMQPVLDLRDIAIACGGYRFGKACRQIADFFCGCGLHRHPLSAYGPTTRSPVLT